MPKKYSYKNKKYPTGTIRKSNTKRATPYVKALQVDLPTPPGSVTTDPETGQIKSVKYPRGRRLTTKLLGDLEDLVDTKPQTLDENLLAWEDDYYDQTYANINPHIVGVPTGATMRRKILPELWVLIRACAEGRRLSIHSLSDLTGISYETIYDRAKTCQWDTKQRLVLRKREMITAFVDKIFELDRKSYSKPHNENEDSRDLLHNQLQQSMNEQKLSPKAGARKAGPTVESTQTTATEELDQKILDIIPAVNTPPGSNPPDPNSDTNDTNTDTNDDRIMMGQGDNPLRDWENTDAKEKPTKSQMIPAPTDRGASNANSLAARMLFVENMKEHINKEIQKRSDLHTITMSEIASISLNFVADQVAQDPGLGLLYAADIEKLDKIARRTYRMDKPIDPLKDIKVVEIMSDPEFIPQPTIKNADA